MVKISYTRGLGGPWPLVGAWVWDSWGGCLYVYYYRNHGLQIRLRPQRPLSELQGWDDAPSRQEGLGG